jgi:chromosomal replication initiator protein
VGREQDPNEGLGETPQESPIESLSFFDSKPNAGSTNQLDPVTATNSIREQLSDLIGVDRFGLWFSDPTCLLVGRDRVTVFAESEFELQRIQNSFGVELRDVVNATCGPTYQLTYEVAVSAKAEPEVSPAPVDSSETPELLEPSAKKRTPRNVGLRQFCFGETNRLAETASEQTLRQPGQFSPLLVYGPTGSGKTLLLDCLVTEFRKRMSMGRCVMITAEQFTSNFVHSLRGAGLPMFRRKYRDLDMLAIDDIHFLSGKHATMVEMQYTIDHLIRAGKQVVISSDRPPMELSQLGQELCARLTGGLICPLQYPCEESRYEILKRMCRERDFHIPSATLRFVASRVSRDVRRLSGAINRIQADSLCTGRKVTVEYASEILGDLISVTATAASMAQIERAVCDFCGVTSGELKSVSRAKRVSAARMLAMWLSREYTTNAYSEIGQFFGGRTHSTVIAAGKRVKGWISDNHRIDLPNTQCSTREAIERIESKLRITG